MTGFSASSSAAYLGVGGGFCESPSIPRARSGREAASTSAPAMTTLGVGECGRVALEDVGELSGTTVIGVVHTHSEECASPLLVRPSSVLHEC